MTLLLPQKCELELGILASKETLNELINGVLAKVEASWLEERRGQRRFPFCSEVEITPFDIHGRPIAETFVAATKDISLSGLAILHSAPILFPYLAVTIPSVGLTDCRVALEVVRRRQIGSLWEIAGAFLMHSE